ncbi:MAG: DUF983 domain-containing protein, partial [Steroidobacteraceae bacterium]
MTQVQSFWNRPVVRGLMGKCPACGQGNMFRKFLKVADACPACREELHHHRADDFPAYLVIVIVGHVVVALTLVVEAAFAPPLWLHAIIWLPITVLMALLLIQPIKGLVVAWQWQGGMDGFAAAKRAREAAML